MTICPVCGYLMQHPATDYHICPSCGTEFGYDDAGRSHAELRAEWLRSGAKWWSPVDPQPPQWDPYLQLENLASGDRDDDAGAGPQAPNVLDSRRA